MQHPGEQFVEIPVPQVVAEMIQVSMIVPQERVMQHTGEQFGKFPVQQTLSRRPRSPRLCPTSG